MQKINLFKEQYFFLSNFYPASVKYDKIKYKNAEAAFQAQKATDEDIRKEFANMNPSQAKLAGRNISLRPDWESIKVQIMTDIVRAKFEQNPELMEKLLLTGNSYLEEGNTWGDRVWGRWVERDTGESAEDGL